ncbi:MAG: stage II sporulation protein R [Firmicutes bacterium]|nr:stage II sporulation protein R [Bacillota bacterium]
MKKMLIFASLVLVLVSASAFIPSCAEMAIYDDVIRLHVLANSDSEYDQSLKLYVRDAVLLYTDELIGGAADKEEAERILEASTESISEAARLAVSEYGGEYDVNVTLSVEEYPRCVYGAVTLPAGSYTSLRVMIGAAEGENWWCVLFPQLCTSLAVDIGEVSNESEDEDEAADEDDYVAAGFTPPEYRIITKSDESVTYSVKFRLIEIIEDIISAFRD